MSYRSAQRRICRRKVRYLDPDQAQVAADAWGQSSYRCPWCDLWHLTSRGLASM